MSNGIAAQIYNEKPMVLSFFPSGKDTSEHPQEQLFRLDGKKIVLSSFKKAETGEDFILRLFTLGKTKVIVFGLQVYKGQKKIILDHLPEDTSHLVSVHFDKGSCHFDFFHVSLPPKNRKINIAVLL
jgi:alpha-mannosidase